MTITAADAKVAPEKRERAADDDDDAPCVSLRASFRVQISAPLSLLSAVLFMLCISGAQMRWPPRFVLVDGETAIS
jgi:hypothetical protein